MASTINGGDVNIAGAMVLGNGANSSVSARIDTGSLGIGGQTGAVTVAPAGKLVPRGTLTAQAASTIGGTLAIRYDVDALLAPGRIHSEGRLTLGEASVLEISGSGTLTAPFHILASGSSGVSGTFGTVTGIPSGYNLVYDHDNGSGSPVVALVGPSTPYQTWAESFSLSGADAATGADPDADGFNHLMEFALGRNPVTSDGPGPILGRDGNSLTLTFNHIAGGNLTFSIQSSDSLSGTWNTIHTYAPFSSAGTATYTDSVAIGNTPSRFIRLSVVMAN